MAATRARWDWFRCRRVALALPLGKARLDARFEAGEIPVAAVDDAPFGVHQDGLERPVVVDVGDRFWTGPGSKFAPPALRAPDLAADLQRGS